jgi:hypothetical protein
MFVKLLDVENNLPIVSHVAKLRIVQNGELELCNFSNIRVFAISISVGGHSYVVPMPNSCEID